MSQPHDEHPDIKIPDNIIEFQRLVVSGNRFHEVCATIRVACICLAVSGSIGMIVWGAVRISDKPAWLVLLLAVLAPTGLVAGIFRYLAWRSAKGVRKLEEERKEELSGGNNKQGKD